ncbi:MAG: hypothetical protein ACRC8E_08875 [Plesiomonas shigelloides]
MKVLVIYEAVPEQTYVAKVEMCSDIYDKLKAAHGYTVNSVEMFDENKSMLVNAIAYGFSTDKSHLQWCENDLERDLFGTMKDISMTEDARDLSGIEAMIHCAILM